MLLIDAFPANNEISLIEFRINYLFDHVDFFVICESDYTHSGKKKPLHISRWLQDKPNLAKKILIFLAELKSEEKFDSNWGRWENEISQRTQLAKFIHENFADARYILSDADELPSRRQVEKLRFINSPHRFITRCSYLHANFLGKGGPHKNWCHGIMGLTSLPVLENGGRYVKYPILDCTENGLHLSYMINDLKSIKTKLEANASQRFNQEYFKSPLFLNFCSDMAISPLGEFHTLGLGLLEIQNKDDYSEMQKIFWSMFPSFFGASSTVHSINRRVFSSLLVSAIQTQFWHREELLRAFIFRVDRKRFKLYVVVYSQILYSLRHNIRNLLVKIRLRKIPRLTRLSFSK